MKFIQNILFIVFMLLGVVSFSQEISVQTTVSQNPVSVGKQFQITVTVYQSQGEVNMKQIPGLEFLGGPSYSQRFETINGKTSQVYSFAYTFRAKKEGKINIPAIAVRTSDGVKNTKAITITAVKGNTKPGANQNFQAILTPTKRKLYLGEEMTLHCDIYNRYNNVSVENVEVPDLDGFWSEEVELKNVRWEKTQKNGLQYDKARIKTNILYPQKTGTLTLTDFDIEGVISKGFFGRSKEEISARSGTVKIEVLPLPAGKSADHLGTFSQLTMSSKINTTELNANEGIQLEITYKGKGNLKLIPEPDFKFPSDFEVYDPKVKDRINVTANGMSGSRTFEYLIIPRTAGEFTIPQITHSFFNPSTEKYGRVSSELYNLTIGKSVGGESAMTYSFDNKTDVQVIGQDIRFILPSLSGLKSKSSHFFLSAPFLALSFAPPLLFIGLFFFLRKKEEEEKDADTYLQKRASKKFTKHLKEAESLIHQKGEFYDALHKGLHTFLSEKLKLSTSEMKDENIKKELEKEIDNQQVTELFEILEQCEMSRYAPSATSEPAQLLAKTKTWISNFGK